VDDAYFRRVGTFKHALQVRDVFWIRQNSHGSRRLARTNEISLFWTACELAGLCAACTLAASPEARAEVTRVSSIALRVASWLTWLRARLLVGAEVTAPRFEPGEV
jgi:hypothetical protein